MYSKDDMILWSMISSMVVNIGKIEILAFSPEYLFRIFKKSSELGINILKGNYKEVLEVINILKDGTEKEKIKIFFSDFKMLKNLRKQIDEEKKIMAKNDIKFITYFCYNYPQKLRASKIPPFVLYYKGEEIDEKNLDNSICIVGTRKPEGKNIEEFTEEIIKNMKGDLKYNISGLAVGCDCIGHKVSLKYNIKNIAILGQGLGSEIYPKEHLNLANEILNKGGTIISEIPPSLKVKGIYLLQRNRIQAYLTEELLILETGKKGGTVTTLKVAFSEKKRVYIRNIKINQTIFNMKNISKVTFISSYSDINLIKILTSKPNTLFTFEFS
ncbi:DNA-processing protein DprA [Cetobacterium somerae]|uniref:DNA-processing protein DprA n=1 Tax=Cetobacterium somerae TaxID=188913 RepID=UPI001F05553C|nr:DNA-processing protein DprA [Cetobacterium somerae]MCX3066544.1 DNA-processing protein DprA [Cetobacterium somerae]UPO98195.1 DNA-protecting protein DprA [Cetobacterium somerae]